MTFFEAIRPVTVVSVAAMLVSMRSRPSLPDRRR